MALPDFIPVVSFDSPLGQRLWRALLETPDTDDPAVEELLWEAEVYHAQGDEANLVIALELLGF